MGSLPRNGALGLQNLEIRDVPVDLLGPAHGLLMAITGYMKTVKPIAANEGIGGHFNLESQAVIHRATLRPSEESSPEHTDMLRIVDIDEPASAAFPCRLFATHLITMAGESRSAAARETLLRRATEIYPGRAVETTDLLSEAPKNPNNFFAWQDLGFALADQGRDDEAIAAFEQAIARWPAGAKKNKEMFLTEIEARRLPSPETSRISAFWAEVNVEATVSKMQGAWPGAIG